MESAVKRNQGDFNKAVDPSLPIIDAHHHLWMRSHPDYLIDKFQADLADGHNIQATIYVECGAMYRRTGDSAMRSVGEAEFVAGMAAMSDSGNCGKAHICAGFVGGVDLTIGERVEEVIHALAIASGGRLRGIRAGTIWDADPTVNTGSRPFSPQGLLLDPLFRSGFRCLVQENLVYDAWQYYPQLPDLCDLADAFPNCKIVVNHCGGLLGIGPYAGSDNFNNWKSLIAEAAKRPNMLMKLGGLAPARCGFNYEGRSQAPKAEDLAADWAPYIETCIELFGDSRCMFESNFPIDMVGGSYLTVWNAFKAITTNCSSSEKANLFYATAKSTYQITV